jgi:3-oxo-5alpha-steroid 4-dehydrogenase
LRRDRGARRRGHVLVLERGSGVSGTTTNAAGHFYLGGGTPVQVACGFEDTAQDMYDYLTAVTPDPAPEKIRLYCDESVDHFHWLEAHGVPFDRSYYPYKSVVQPTRECLIWTGNEKVWPYRDQAGRRRAAIRWHSTVRRAVARWRRSFWPPRRGNRARVPCSTCACAR